MKIESIQSHAGDFIIRIETGKSLVAASFNSGTTTVPVAEALALLNSLVYAKEQGFSKIEVEGNSKLVIDAVNGVLTPPWKLLKLIHDIKFLSNSFEFVCFQHVFRETNFVTNVLANLGHMLSNLHCWEECVPSEASSALAFDIVNLGCIGGTSI
ncbi:hypothetical protein ACLB2K_056298 [Fragaria x ananassa]